jgi:hypothetical protein
MKVTLKKNNYEIFRFLAEHNAVLEGITDPEAFEERVEELVYMMCEEAFCHSLTPSGDLANNPLSKKLAEPLVSNIVKQFFSGTDKQVRQLEGELIKSINNLVGIFMKIKIPKKTLEKYSKKVYYEKSDSLKVNRDNMREIETNRYFDLMVSSLLYGWIHGFFQQEVGQYEKLLQEGINRVDISKMELGKNETRMAFINLFFEMGKSQAEK